MSDDFEADPIWMTRLYQGSKPPEGRVVRDAGFDVLVLCAFEHQGGDYEDVFVLHCPLEDRDPEGDDPKARIRGVELTQAKNTARSVAAYVNGGNNVLVTCAAGRNRSGFVTALALNLITGWPGEHCVKHVKKHRRNERALTNNYFVRELEKL